MKLKVISLILSSFLINFSAYGVSEDEFKIITKDLFCSRNLPDTVQDRSHILGAYIAHYEFFTCQQRDFFEVVIRFMQCAHDLDCEAHCRLGCDKAAAELIFLNRHVPLVEILAQFFLDNALRQNNLELYIGCFDKFPSYITIPLAYHILFAQTEFHDYCEGAYGEVINGMLQFKIHISQWLLNFRAVKDCARARKTIKYIVKKLEEKIKARKTVETYKNLFSTDDSKANMLCFCDPIFAAAYEGRDDILKELYDAGINFDAQFLFNQNIGIYAKNQSKNKKRSKEDREQFKNAYDCLRKFNASACLTEMAH